MPRLDKFFCLRKGFKVVDVIASDSQEEALAAFTMKFRETSPELLPITPVEVVAFTPILFADRDPRSTLH